MELHPRLHEVDVKQKQASISLDEFLPTGEKTHAKWWVKRGETGLVLFVVTPEQSGPTLGGSAPTVAEALEALAAFTNEHYGTVVVEPGYTYGLEFIGEDSGLPTH